MIKIGMMVGDVTKSLRKLVPAECRMYIKQNVIN